MYGTAETSVTALSLGFPDAAAEPFLVFVGNESGSEAEFVERRGQTAKRCSVHRRGNLFADGQQERPVREDCCQVCQVGHDVATFSLSRNR